MCQFHILKIANWIRKYVTHDFAFTRGFIKRFAFIDSGRSVLLLVSEVGYQILGKRLALLAKQIVGGYFAFKRIFQEAWKYNREGLAFLSKTVSFWALTRGYKSKIKKKKKKQNKASGS